jgi:hypothetical protein
VAPLAPSAERALAALNERQGRFVRAFIDNGGIAVAAAREAGYANPESNASRVLASPVVQTALAALRGADGTAEPVRTAEDVLAWWGSLVADPVTPLRERLRASEMIARSLGLFSDTITTESAEQREARRARETKLRALDALVRLEADLDAR